METNLANKAITNIVWKFSERILAQVVSLVVSVVIARILNPDDYSVVSLVVIFFSFADVFISGGFNTALIQKKDADSYDYSSVLIISLLVSCVVYAILFVLAPFFSRMYKQPIFTQVLRIMGLVLPITAFKSIWCAYISSKLQFRKFFYATIGGTVLSGVVGITMALKGMGPWALVAQQMTNTTVDTLILLISTRLKLSAKVSYERLRTLFKYGWKVFLSSLIGLIYSETTPLVIGLRFTPSDLSFYSKGKGFPSLLSTTVTNTLSAVLFPVVAKCQDDRERVLKATRMFVQFGSFIMFPILLGFFAVADNFIEVVLTTKWMNSVFYVRLFCFVAMFDIIGIGNCETIKAIGRSDIYLKIEVIKKVLYFTVLMFFICLSNRPEMLAMSYVVCTFIAVTVNAIPNIKLIGYQLRYQVSDMFLSFICSAMMCVAVMLIGKIELNIYFTLVIQILSGIVVYIALSWIINRSTVKELLFLIKKRGICSEEDS